MCASSRCKEINSSLRQSFSNQCIANKVFYNNRSHCKQPLVVALLGCVTRGARGLGDEVFSCTTVIRVTGFSLCESASAEGRPSSVLPAVRCAPQTRGCRGVWRRVRWDAAFRNVLQPARKLEQNKSCHSCRQPLTIFSLVSAADGTPKGDAFCNLRLFVRVLAPRKGRRLAPSHVGFRGRKRDRYGKFC